MILRSSRSSLWEAILSSSHALFELLNALIPLVSPHMRHERLQDVAAVSPFASALWLGLVPPSVVGMPQTACPFLRASVQVSPVVLLAVLVLPAVLPAEPF